MRKHLLFTLSIALLSSKLIAADPPTTQSAIHTIRYTESQIRNPDDPPTITRQSIYDREKGLLMLEPHAHGAYVFHAIPGKTIQYRLGRDRATIAPFGYDMTSERLTAHFNNLILNPAATHTRDPDQDLTIDGEKLLAYITHFPSSKNDYTEWADTYSLVHRSELEIPSSRDSKGYIARTEREFNPELSSDFWTDPPNLHEIDVAAEFAKAHPLTSALWTKEIDGNTLAIESLSRDADGDFFVVTSWRQNAANLAVTRSNKMMVSSPSASIWYTDPLTHKPNLEWRDITFATMTAPGIYLQFHFIVPHTPDMATDHAAFSFMYNYQPAPADGKFPPNTVSHEMPPLIPFDLKTDNSTDTISAFAGRTFDALDPFDGLTFPIRLDGGIKHPSNPNDDAFAAWTREEFITQTARYLTVHQRMQAERPPPRPSTMP